MGSPAKRSSAQQRMSHLNDCLLSSTPYPMENVRRLIVLTGQMLNATHALYSWRADETLYTPGQWRATGANGECSPIDAAEGRIASDLLDRREDAPLLIRRLPETLYAQTDPLVLESGAQTCLGCCVRCDGAVAGCLYLLFPDDRRVSFHDREFFGIVVAAIVVEERRKRLEEERERNLRRMVDYSEGLENEIRERRRAEHQLLDALAQVKTLNGLLPICASCKKIRDDQGYWSQVEVYIRQRTEAEFTHSICPDCFSKLYPGHVMKI